MTEQTKADAPTSEMVLVQAFRAFKKQRDAVTADALKHAVEAHLASAYSERLKELQDKYGVKG